MPGLGVWLCVGVCVVVLLSVEAERCQVASWGAGSVPGLTIKVCVRLCVNA